jgi:hypothetical protein
MRFKFFLVILAIVLGSQADACSPPMNFSLTWKFDNSATFSLNFGGSSNHQISISPVGTGGAGAGVLHRFSGTITTTTGLVPSTSYTAYIRDSCTNGTFSPWVGPLTFTTSCSALPTPWFEPFDSNDWTPAPNNQAGIWPNCWTRTSSNTGLSFVTGPPPFNSFNTGPSDDHSIGNSGKYVYLDAIGFGGTGTSTQFLTPIIDLGNLIAPELSFWYHAFGNQIFGSQVHLIDSAGAATLLWSSLGQQQISQSSPWVEVNIDLTNYANQKIHLRFTGISTSPIAFYCQLAFDDLDIHETPPCPKPTALTALSLNHNTATLSWLGGTGPYILKYGPSGFNPSVNGNRLTANSSPFTITNLSPSTVYEIYIKDSCGLDSVSLWGTGISIETSCAPFNAPFQENFESISWSPGSWTNLPGSIDPCWTRSPGINFIDFFWGVGSGQAQSTITGPNQGINNGKYLYTAGWGGGNANRALLTSPWINTSALSIPLVRFYSHLFGTNIDKLQVFADSGGGWHNISNILPTQSTANSPWQLHEILLNDYIGKTIRFRFRGFKIGSNSYSEIAIDEFALLDACYPVTNLSLSGLSPTGAIINFTAGGGSTNLSIGTTGYNPSNTLSTGTNISSPYNVTGLIPNTTYDVYLKDSCANGLASAWVGPLTFTTQPCPAVSANFTSAVVGMNVILSAQNLSPTNTYQWTVTNSSGTVVASPNSGSTTVPIAMQGTYTIRLIVANFCGNSDTVQTTVNVCAPLSGGFSYGVNGNTVTFTSLANNATGVVWTFGDGGQSSATNPVHSYAVSGPYTVTMKAYNICGDTVTASQVVITCTNPTAEWVANVLSSNGAGMRVQFEAGPWCSPDVVGYQWLFGDGTQGFGANPIKTYAVPGLFYNVSLIASNDCGGKDTLTKSLRTVGLDEASVSALWYPNPAASGQWISSPSDGDVAVYTLTGQRLAWPQRAESGRVLVQVPEYCPAGVYVLWQGGQAVRLTVQ